ncbi:MAG: hypothetical protein H0W40_02380 [Methylibium sp.]|uniref:hypothetical protein n=1 Tax=Methylibium sp. TaxID=2067992 RepID=UPI0017910AEF|nr:hypothetical protein [Methylibium sp.]MBA3596211.1 hypothetical protein [Methylibium sp.]
MLDELESVVRPSARRSARRGSGWLLATVLSVAALAASWWWSQQREANPSLLLDRGHEGVFASPPGIEKRRTAAYASAAPVAVTAARIEALPEKASAQHTAAVASAETPASATALAAPPLTTAAVQASGFQTGQKVKAFPRPSATGNVAEPKRVQRAEPAAPVRRIASTSASATLTRANSQTPNPVGNRPDADVLLLSALLEHVSSEGQGDPHASPHSVTLAQVVRRCELHSGKSTAQALECRQRICQGYWGKAEACPARLAPKKKS